MEHLKEMPRIDDIHRSNSPFSSKVVIIQKKDGAILFCTYRKLKQHTKKTHIDNTLHLLAGAKYFTKLDLKSGYWQVELKEEDKPRQHFKLGHSGFLMHLDATWPWQCASDLSKLYGKMYG